MAKSIKTDALIQPEHIPVSIKQIIVTEARMESRDYSRICAIPTSPAVNLIMESLAYGNDIGELPRRKGHIRHDAKYEVRKGDKKYQIIETTAKANITLEISNIELFTGCNKTVKKLFVLILKKLNEQAVFNGVLSRDYISFPLKELIDIGFYKTPQSARKGFNAGIKALKKITLSGEIQKTKKKKTEIVGMSLFRYGIIDDNQCIVRLENGFNWAALTQYITILPRYYFRLPVGASDLLFYIFYLARQNTQEIEKRGYFTIGFRAIHARLALPSESDTVRHQQLIKQPIEDAIERIEEEHNLMFRDSGLQLLPCYDENASIKEYLDNGYLKVSLSGSFAENFIKISKETAKQIEQAEKQKARIIEKAAAIKAANKIETASEK